MLFNSLAYILFLAFIVGLFHFLPADGRWMALLGGSFFCYGFWRLDYLVLLILCIAINYVAAVRIADAGDDGTKKFYLKFSIFGSLGLLFVFKYLDFALDSVVSIGRFLGFNLSPLVLNILLPIGISFYIFQALGYVIDVYWGIIEPERHFGKFCLFVSFFPQLIAGPIEKAQELLPQIASLDKKPSESLIYPGVSRIFWGLFKKVVVADNVSLYTDVVFNNIDQHQGLTLYFATVLFAVQIYCDFSGYTDIAIGSARLLGVRLSENFLMPYNSTTVQEFWSRWHRTLYTWLYSYVYMPLAYSNPGKKGVIIAVLGTFALSGLWHGASWNFVLFGLTHGVWILLEVVFYTRFPGAKATSLLGKLLSGLVTFHVWLCSLVWFRAATFNDATTLFRRLFSSLALDPLDRGVLARIIVGILILVMAEQLWVKRYNFEQLYGKSGKLGAACVMLSSLLLMILLGNSGGGQFIYFQF